MGIKEAKYIWLSGEFVPWKEAKVHVLTHALHYGSAVFEGIRAYNTKSKGTAVFRLRDHIRRLIDSAKIYRMEVQYTIEEIEETIKELIRKNELKECYIRPLVFRGYGDVGVNPLNNPVEMMIAVWEWGEYLGEGALENGVDVMISSWARMAPNTFPALSKATANYANAQLIKMESLEYGFIEGIALTVDGLVAEGSAANVFAVRDGVIYTPPFYESILPGITRDSIIKIIKKLGMQVVETPMPREFLYIADEVFFVGTASEVTPIRSIDKIQIGSGHRGPITERIQKEFFAIVRGEKEDEFGWLTPVYE